MENLKRRALTHCTHLLLRAKFRQKLPKYSSIIKLREEILKDMIEEYGEKQAIENLANAKTLQITRNGKKLDIEIGWENSIVEFNYELA